MFLLTLDIINSFVFNNVMSNKMIVFASILGAILATSLLALNSSMVANAGA
jgi:hypothetical protein